MQNSIKAFVEANNLYSTAIVKAYEKLPVRARQEVNELPYPLYRNSPYIATLLRRHCDASKGEIALLIEILETDCAALYDTIAAENTHNGA